MLKVWNLLWRGGLTSLALGLALVAFYAVVPAQEARGDDQHCGSVSVSGSDDSIGFSATTGTTIEGICIKSGVNMFGGDHSSLFTSDSNDGCYVVDFNSTMTSVTVTRVGDGSNCQGLSHIDVVLVAGQGQEQSTPPATNTTAPTNTSVPATNTSVAATATNTAEVAATATATSTETTSGLGLAATSTAVVPASGVQGGADQSVGGPNQGSAGAQQQAGGVAPSEGVAGVSRLPSTGSGAETRSDTLLIAGLVLMLVGGALASSRLTVRQ